MTTRCSVSAGERKPFNTEGTGDHRVDQKGSDRFCSTLCLSVSPVLMVFLLPLGRRRWLRHFLRFLVVKIKPKAGVLVRPRYSHGNDFSFLLLLEKRLDGLQ